MNCQATNYGNSFRIRNVETARITTTGLSIAPNNGNRNLTQALDVLGNSIVSGYTFSSGKIRFRIHHNNFTLPSGMASLLNGGTVSFQSNVTLSAGIFISQIAGVYCVTCKLRLPDSNSQAPEINGIGERVRGNNHPTMIMRGGFLPVLVADVLVCPNA